MSIDTSYKTLNEIYPLVGYGIPLSVQRVPQRGVRDVFLKGFRNNHCIDQGCKIPISDIYNPRQLLVAYSTPAAVSKMVIDNPKIQQILKENGLKTKIYPENIANLCNSHIITTTAYAMQIANEMDLPKNEKQILEKACIFHDFGKILIPSKIIQKPGALTEKEKKIVDLHAQLGYELLSTTGINKRVLELIKNHHNPMPEKSDVLSQILSVADIYSALREVRSYKNTVSQESALNLLDQKAMKGEVSTEVVNALKKALSSEKTA